MRKLFVVVVFFVALGGVVGWLLTSPRTLSADDLPDHAPDVANGERLYYAGGCSSCHAAPDAEEDAKNLLVGGLALESPFGTFYVPNITPDPDSGIGGWSDSDFVNAVKFGVSPGGSHYYPSFPYTSYQRMPVADILDLKAFMDTLPAAASRVPDHDLPFPFSVRRSLGGWKLLYVDGETFTPDPDADDLVNRGAYLAEGPGHCGECHTPRDPLGGPIRGRWLAGGPNPEGEGFIPNITPHETGLGGWSEADIAYALESGFTPEFDSFGGQMVDVQMNFAKLPAADRTAVAAYLKAVPPLPTERPERPEDPAE